MEVVSHRLIVPVPVAHTFIGHPRIGLLPCDLRETFRGSYEAEVAAVGGAAEETGVFIFDAPDRFAETAFFAGADFFATFAVEAFFAAFRTLAHRAF